MNLKTENIVIGGGIAGLSTAFHLVQRKQKVTLIEAKTVGHCASQKAAGMITPASEVHLGEDHLMDGFLKCAAYYNEFTNIFTKNKPQLVDYQQSGSLLCATEPNGEQDLLRLTEFQKSMGLDVQEISSDKLKTLEPLLSPQMSKAYLAKNESHIDNELLVSELKNYLLESGYCQIVENQPVTNAKFKGDTLESITVGHLESQELKADRFIFSTGLQHDIPELSQMLKFPLRPVKGQVISVQCAPGTIMRPIRVYHRYPIYLVPREDGRVIIGATSEELVDQDLTAGGVMDLIYSAWQALPIIFESPIVEMKVGQRPATPDHKPIVGPTEISNLYVLNGLYRHGIMAAPFLAQQLVKMMSQESLDFDLTPFHLERFKK